MTDRNVTLSVEDQRLKAASKLLIRNFGGGDAVSAALGRRQQHYSDCGLANVDTWLTVHDVARLEDCTAGMAGHPPITRALAARAGFALVRLPGAVSPEPLLPMIGRLAVENADVSTAICAALEDGTIDDDEVERIDREIDGLIDLALRMKAAAHAYAKGDR